MAKQEFKAGDKIVFGRGKRNSAFLTDVTIGKIYTLFEDGDGSLVFEDDVSDYSYSFSGFSQCKATKIIETT